MTVISMSDKTNDAKFITPKELLEETLKDEEFMKFEKILIIGVRPDEYKYSVEYRNAKLTTEEGALALEIARKLFLKDNLGDPI